MRSVCAIFFGILIIVLSCNGARAQSRIALIVGNSQYTQISPLANPKNDAALMARTLRELGFEVVLSIDANRRDMGRSILEFGKKLRHAGKDSIGLFYYAGHGIQARGANFLVPIGATIQDDADFDIEAINVSNILSQLRSAGNALNIVILDACRNNPYPSSDRSGGRGLARLEAASGTFVAFAAGPGQVAEDGRGTNSTYTAALAIEMRQPGLTVEQVFKRVRVKVEDETGGNQTPWEESSLRGDFYFQSKPEQPNQGDQVERAHWNTINESNDIVRFQNYINEYPEGMFSEVARLKIDMLEAEATKRAAAAEQARIEEERRKVERAARIAEELQRKEEAARRRLEEESKREEERKSAAREARRAADVAFWNSVRNTNDPVLVQTYLARFPDGIFSELAQATIVQLHKQAELRSRISSDGMNGTATPDDNPNSTIEPSAENQKVALLDPDTVTSPGPVEDLPLKIQTELARLGCSPGTIDGVWGKKSETALSRFARHANTTLPGDRLSRDTLKLLEQQLTRVCPLRCGVRQVDQNGRCVAKTCPRGHKLSSSGVCRKAISKATATRKSNPKPAPTQRRSPATNKKKPTLFLP